MCGQSRIGPARILQLRADVSKHLFIYFLSWKSSIVVFCCTVLHSTESVIEIRL